MKNVLMITGTTLRNDTNSGKTLIALFNKFNAEDLSQLYFSIEKPNVTVCKSYYQVNDWMLLNSGLGLFPQKCGMIYCKDDIDTNDNKPEVTPASLKKHSKKTIMLISRNVLWSVSRWRNQRFKNWIDNNAPSTIFTILSGNYNLVKTTLDIAKKYNCKVVMFVSDDFYNDYSNSKSILRKLHYKRIHKINRQLSDYLYKVIGCSEQAAKEFGELFNCPYEALFTPCNQTLLDLPYKDQYQGEIITLRYFGGVGLERWKVLRSLAEEIRNYNTSRGGTKEAILEIYSSVNDKEIIASLSLEKGCVFKGWVSGNEFLKLLSDASIAVHVESFSEEMIRRTRLSVSTKITDYLGAGKCIFAIGDKQLASINHLQGVASVATSTEEIGSVLFSLLTNSEMRTIYQKKARSFAIEKHDADKIGDRMIEIMQEASERL